MIPQLDLDQNDERQRPAMRLRNLILTESIRSGARAIRLRPGQEAGDVEYQLGGEWRPVMRIPIAAFPHVVSSLKAAGEVSAEGSGALEVRLGGELLRVEVSTARAGTGDEVMTMTLPDVRS